MVSTMPAAEPTRTTRDPRLATVVFWTGVGLAPLALLIMVVVGSSGAIEVALGLGLISIVLIGVSMALRRDTSSLKSEVEELVYDEIDTLRDDIREDISHAARATHKSLADRIVHLSETVDVLRGQVDTMRDQVDRVTTPPVPPHAPGVGHVPGGVLRHTETVQVTTRQTMLVDPHDPHRDGTVYGGARQPGFAPAPDQPFREPDRHWQPSDARGTARPGGPRTDDAGAAYPAPHADDAHPGPPRAEDARAARPGASRGEDDRAVRSGAPRAEDDRGGRPGAPRADGDRRPAGPGRARVETGGAPAGAGRARVEQDSRYEQAAPATGRAVPGRIGQGTSGRATVSREPSGGSGFDRAPSGRAGVDRDRAGFDREPSGRAAFDQEPSGRATVGQDQSGRAGLDRESSGRAGFDREPSGRAGFEQGAPVRPGAGRASPGRARVGEPERYAGSRVSEPDHESTGRARGEAVSGDINGVLQRGAAGSGAQSRRSGLADVFQRRAESETPGSGWQSGSPDDQRAPFIPQQRRAPALESTAQPESWSEQMLRERLNRPDDREPASRRSDDRDVVNRRSDDRDAASRSDDRDVVSRRSDAAGRSPDDRDAMGWRSDDRDAGGRRQDAAGRRPEDRDEDGYDRTGAGRRRAEPEPDDRAGRRRREEPPGGDPWRSRIEESPSGNAWSRQESPSGNAWSRQESPSGNAWSRQESPSGNAWSPQADDRDGSGEWSGRRRAPDDSYESDSGRAEIGRRRARDDDEPTGGFADPSGREYDDGGRRRALEDGGQRRAYDEDDAARITGVRTTDRWASVRSDDHGARELRMGERRAAVHEDATGSEVRIEDRWASVREEPAIESPRRSQARQDRDREWGPADRVESSWTETRDGTGEWQRRQSAPALPAGPQADDDSYAWNRTPGDRGASSHRLVDFEDDDDRWR